MAVVDTIAEPVAAAWYYTTRLGRALPLGSELAVFDLGGGTLDVATVRRDPEGFTVVASGGADDLGGLDFDAALFSLVGERIAATDPVVWSRLYRPVTTAHARAWFALWQDVRTAKKLLSRASVATVHVPGVEVGTHITRAEYEAAVAPLAERAAEITAGVLARHRPIGLFLVGGGSRTPLVADRLHRRLGIAPLVLEKPELVVAEGALSQVTDLITRVGAAHRQRRDPPAVDPPEGAALLSVAARPPARRAAVVATAVVVLLALVAGIAWWQIQGRPGKTPTGLPSTSTSASPAGPTALTFPASRPSQLVADDADLLAAVTRWDGMAWDGCRLADDAAHRPDGARNNPVGVDPVAAPERVVHCRQSTFTALFARYQSFAGGVAEAYQRGGSVVPPERARGLQGTLIEIDRWSSNERALVWWYGAAGLTSVVLFMVTGRSDIDLITILDEFAGPA